ncbi:hypothetical protein H6P81_005144 [Aristolochia fimbriata]|uniref:Uncharacterized protein n=1 Tax=Aristolochia fimbriata TaxID=158543 RepID=A0AAV7ETM8_ARIFI|nr:hypothetical protein H6P81_005144 [Aristolochia fimbriata]
MKASLKLREERRNPLLKAKVPVTVLGLPFVSGVTAGDPSDLSFHIRTSSDAGPSLSFAYKPNDRFNPFTLTLKSGVGVLGSPDSSPLILAAHFSLVGRASPSFSIQIRPRFGNFFLKRTALSSSLLCPSPVPASDPLKENGGNPALLTDFKSASGFFSGVSVSANTELPVTKRAAVRFRWGVNFPVDLGKQLPFLTVEKVSVGRVEEAKPRSASDSPVKDAGDDVDVLKGMCLWMGREVDALRRENKFIRESIEDLKSRLSIRNEREVAVLAKRPPVVGDSGDFDSWRKKKNGSGGASHATSSPIGTTESDVEAELKKAIKAASFT